MKTQGNDLVNYGHSPLTKREYFAAKAMQGILSVKNYGNQYELVADDAVLYADALIEQLNNENNGKDS